MSDPIEVIAERKAMTNKPRIAVRDAVKKVLGNTGAAITGDDLYEALRADGWELYRPEECEIDPIMEFIPEGDPIPEGAFEVMEGLWAKRVGERVILETRLVPVSEGTEQ